MPYTCVWITWSSHCGNRDHLLKLQRSGPSLVAGSGLNPSPTPHGWAGGARQVPEGSPGLTGVSERAVCSLLAGFLGTPASTIF